MTLTDAFLRQARACEGLGSPFMGQLLRLLARNWHADLPLAPRFAAWPGDLGPSGASLPLRLAGGLHALVLSGRDPALARAYPPNHVPDATLWAEVERALFAHARFLEHWCSSAPQTNELRRSIALVAAGHALTHRLGLPIVLSELGASGGLNLIWDRYALAIKGTTFGPSDPVLTLAPDWTGPLPPPDTPRVIDRRGVDLNPLDPHDPNDRLRLLAYLWADQPERLERSRAAIAAQIAPVDKGDAIDWLETRLLRHSHPGALHLVYHTVAWQYFPASAQERGTALIEAAGAQATESSPLAWLSMENDGDDIGAALTLRLWPGGTVHALARVDFHGRWINWAGL
ncbi:DUF2332 family protein [Aquicoccus porphyridii]|uniref:DUF2332 family protein n=1 Tax=Aquicoccus porphyridii TaxID=1852029 RepID=A0A5A9Z643_9RHOB|nr:DUF2332 family protein [Aquicoccus porphyridii]KAA0912509.1 DUF2332 family protein [Aquicoccus porphyridii]RAI53189.1 DUF2332 domain-containing protein [Rhodobacteraceae bacterium AsT-22]